MSKILTIIAEPWFTAMGHPAQSLLNTARSLKSREGIIYLASAKRKPSPALMLLASRLENICEVKWFRVPNSSLPLGTLLAVHEIIKLARSHKDSAINVFFLDAHVLVLAAALVPTRWLLPQLGIVSSLVLWGPEKITSQLISRKLIQSFLGNKSNRLFLRTEELATAWQRSFATRAPGQIDALPSLEIHDGDIRQATLALEGPSRFGIFGQVRVGKGIEWLVPLFVLHPQIGTLKVAGKSTGGFLRQHPALRQYAGYEDRFVDEDELLALASSVDYLLILYDHWDHRMEAATLYLAVKALRPVICYAKGWCGRIVTTFDCGIAIHRKAANADFLLSVPSRESHAYQQFVNGLRNLRSSLASPDRTDEFARKIGGDNPDQTVLPQRI